MTQVFPFSFGTPESILRSGRWGLGEEEGKGEGPSGWWGRGVEGFLLRPLIGRQLGGPISSGVSFASVQEVERGVRKCAGGLYRDLSGSRRLVSSMCPRQAMVEGAGGIGFSQALLLLRILGALS